MSNVSIDGSDINKNNNLHSNDEMNNNQEDSNSKDDIDNVQLEVVAKP